MARQKSEIVRIKKTMHVLPETADYIVSAAKSTGIYESSVIDNAIALLRSQDANLSNAA
jgi:hypothetical protein